MALIPDKHGQEFDLALLNADNNFLGNQVVDGDIEISSGGTVFGVSPSSNGVDISVAGDFDNAIHISSPYGDANLRVAGTIRYDNASQVITQAGDLTSKSYVDEQVLLAGMATSYIPNSGRFYMYTDTRWVTDSDDNYGTAYYQFAESGTTATEPVVEWEHKGILMEKGTVLDSLNLLGRTTNLEVTDLEIRVIVRYPDNVGRYQTGIDNDIEMNNVTIFSGNYLETGMTGNTNDHMKKLIPLGDYTLLEDAMVSIYVKPVGTITATRYFTASYTYKIKK